MRLFVAVDVSDEIREKIFNLSRFFNFRGAKAVEKDNIHITLKFIGEVDNRKKDIIVEKLNEIEFESFTVRFKGIGFFPSASKMRVVWAGVEDPGEMRRLAEMVEDKLSEAGIKKERRFLAHATIARIKRIDGKMRSELIKKLEPHMKDDFGEMRVESFALKKSTLTPKGPIYDDVQVFKLK